MTTNNENPKISLTDYLSVLLKWKKLLIINLSFVVVFSIILSFLIPKTYKSTASMILPQDNSMGLGSLGSLVSGGNSALSIGAKLFGVSSTNEDLILGILSSRGVLTKTINKYNLMDYYGISDGNYDKALKAVKGDLIFEPNEYGMIEVSVINEDPDTAAIIANYLVGLADSLHIAINIEQAARSRKFIERRFLQNQDDLRNAEENFKNFQKKYDVLAVPEQIQFAVAAVGELEAQLVEKEIQLNSVKGSISSSSSIYKMLEVQINSIRQRIKDFNKKSLNDDPSMILPLDEIPELQMEYLRLYRELEIQNKILEFIYPLYEQAKLDEQKSTPTLLVIDKAVPAELKYAPKKAFIVLFFTFLALFIHLPFIFRANKILLSEKLKNPVEEKELRFYKKITRSYKISFN